MGFENSTRANLPLVSERRILHTMDRQRGRKLNQLQHMLPDGLLADAAWFENRGYSSALRSKYVARGWLEQPARGVFTRPGGARRWEQVVVSLQSVLGLPVTVGGRTALDLQGHAHYLALGGNERIQLYSETSLPGWLGKLELRNVFQAHNVAKLFPTGDVAKCIANLPEISDRDAAEPETALAGGLRAMPWGPYSWPILVSAPERAILELLDELPDDESFEHINLLVEGMRTLSPRRLQSLLETCDSIKVKRLFLWFADRHHHAWLKHIDKDRINLGSGKRVIARGGRLDRRYQITVPETLYGDE